MKTVKRYLGSEFFMSLLEGRFEFLRDKHKIPEEELKMVLRADPTSKDSEKGFHAGKYSEWIISNYLLSGEGVRKRFRVEDWQKMKEALEAYHRAKPKLDPELRDINKAFPPEGSGTFTKMLDLAAEIKDSGEDKTANEKASSGIETVYQGEEWYVGIPHTFDGMSKLGNRTHWCNASSSYGEGYFDNYYDEGISFVIINEKNRSERYQFHFASEQYMNTADEPVDPSQWCDENPEPTRAMINRVMSKGTHTTGERDPDKDLEALFVLDIVEAIEICKKRGIEYSHRVGVVEKQKLIKRGVLKSEDCDTEKIKYLDNGYIAVHLANYDEELGDYMDDLFEYPEFPKNILTYESQDFWDSQSSWSDFKDEINEKNGAWIKKLGQFIFVGEAMDMEHEVTMDEIDLSTDLDDYDEFEPLTRAIEYAGHDAERDAGERAWHKELYKILDEHLDATLSWQNPWDQGGCWMIVTVPEQLNGYLAEQGMSRSIEEKEFAQVYIDFIVWRDGAISDRWGEYLNPWEPLDEDYFNERLNNQLHDTESEVGYDEKTYAIDLKAYQERQANPEEY